MFLVVHQRRTLKVMVSAGEDWPFALPAFEHASVSLQNRCPKWEEMTKVKDWFWEPEELVVQYHPPRSTYVNQHPHCLHLWKPIGVEIPLPPSLTVGFK
jgi:hypothetical protein